MCYIWYMYKYSVLDAYVKELINYILKWLLSISYGRYVSEKGKLSKLL